MTLHNGLSLEHTSAFLTQFYGSATKAPRSVLPTELLLSQILSYERPIVTDTVPLLKLRTWLSSQSPQYSKTKTTTTNGHSTTSVTPLTLLNQTLILHLKHGGLQATSDLLRRLMIMAHDDLSYLPEPRVTTSTFRETVFWRSKTLAQFMSLLAVPKYRMHDTLDLMLESAKETKDVDALKRSLAASGNTSLSEAFEAAKKKATSTSPTTLPSTTLIHASLIDIAALELAATKSKSKSSEHNHNHKRKSLEDYTSFAHDFVLGVGPEGVVIWQCAEDKGAGLAEYVLERDETRARSWTEAGEWVEGVGKLVARKVRSLKLHFTLLILPVLLLLLLLCLSSNRSRAEAGIVAC